MMKLTWKGMYLVDTACCTQYAIHELQNAVEELQNLFGSQNDRLCALEFCRMKEDGDHLRTMKPSTESERTWKDLVGEFMLMKDSFAAQEMLMHPWEEKKSDLTFGDVLKRLEKDPSLKFGRASWQRPERDTAYVSIQMPDEKSANDAPYMYIVGADGRMPFVPGPNSLLAKDWYQVER